MDIIKLLTIFVLIVFFLGLKQSFNLVIIGATVLVAILFAMPPVDFIIAYGKSVVSPMTIEMLLALWLIMLMESVMTENKYMERIVTAVDNMFRSKIVSIISMPMIIGFLPSLGGARFSAPMVEHAVKGMDLSAERKTILNMHYRHISDVCFPTSPSLIIACSVSGIVAGKFFMMLLPMGIFVPLVGLWFLRGVKNRPDVYASGKWWSRLTKLILALWPFLLLISLMVAFHIPIHLACLMVFVLLLVVIRPNLRTLPMSIWRYTKVNLLLMTVTVLALKDILAASGSLDNLSETISILPVPPIVVFSLAALLVALIAGGPFSSTALTLPLMMAAIPEFTPSMVALITLSAYIGSMLTPTHLCFPITADYFGSNMQKVIIQMLPVYAVIYATALLFYGFLFV